MTSTSSPLAALVPLIGEWRMLAGFGGAPLEDMGARVSYEWLPGEQFIIQRWEIPTVPEAPDGIAILGPDPEREGGFLQHYFDTRGVARIYKMTLENGVWTLWRDSPDFSPLHFRQRYAGTFGDGGNTISGAWEICSDGVTWEKDFDLVYSRVS